MPLGFAVRNLTLRNGNVYWVLVNAAQYMLEIFL